MPLTYGVLVRSLEDTERKSLDSVGILVADNLPGLVGRDVLVVFTLGGLGRWLQLHVSSGVFFQLWRDVDLRCRLGRRGRPGSAADLPAEEYHERYRSSYTYPQACQRSALKGRPGGKILLVPR